jgi:uncharacterized membrane protein
MTMPQARSVSPAEPAPQPGGAARYRAFFAMQTVGALASQAMLFLGRMAFVFASTVFGFVFIANKPNYRAYGFQYLVILAGLFSLYCYTQELERLARTLLPDDRR